jgi:hypothetical protein
MSLKSHKLNKLLEDCCRSLIGLARPGRIRGKEDDYDQNEEEDDEEDEEPLNQ